jgi:chaperonin cofactor prefoldin
MEKDKDYLISLKNKIERAKTTVAELTGQQKSQMNQLKETFGCDTIEDAETKLETMKKSISKLDNQIEQGLEKLEEMYNA